MSILCALNMTMIDPIGKIQNGNCKQGARIFIIEKPIHLITAALFIKNGHNLRYYNFFWKFCERFVSSQNCILCIFLLLQAKQMSIHIFFHLNTLLGI